MPTREELRLATREKVMAAAERLFAQRGFKGTAIRDIAEAAGVSVGSVIAVSDKNGLLVAMFDRAISGMHQNRPTQIPPEEQGDMADGPVDQIMAIFEPFLTLFGTHMDLAREYGAILMSGNHASVVFHELAAMLTAEIARILETAGMRPDKVSAASRGIYLAYLGTLFVWAGSGLADNAEPLRDLRSTIAFLLETEGFESDAHS